MKNKWYRLFLAWAFERSDAFRRILVPLKQWLANLDRAQDLRFIKRLKKEEEKMSELVNIPVDWREEVFALRQEFHKKFSRFVVWGLADMFHTHRFVHRAYYFTAKRLGIPTVWLEDRPESNDLLLPGDFVAVMGNANYWNNSYIKPLPDVYYYFFHLYRHDVIAQLRKEQYLLWQEHKTSCIMEHRRVDMLCLSERDEGLYYNPKLRILIQPYGTDLLPWEFLPPVYNPKQRQVNYVGSFWSVNRDIMQRFIKYLRSVGLKLHLVQRTTLDEQINMIRQSRLAPSISGVHAADNYPPCRMYKNISYGQLGYANVPIHQELYQDCHPPISSIEEMSDYVLRMSKDDYISMIREQQKITQRFTMLQGLMNIYKYF